MQKGKVDVLLGLQWGDEGKGKVRNMCCVLFLLVFSRVVR